MDAGLVNRVRRFNRMVTQRVGALDDAYLARNRPLGAARVLWEIGTPGLEVRELRSRLDLDSGYLSRMLRTLEADGLVVVEPDPADGRVRRARLTAAGQAERAELDRRSDAAAASILAPLDPGQRDRLVAAMVEVERLLLASMVHIGVTDPGLPEARACQQAYFAELGQRFEGGYDPGRAISVDDAELALPRGLLLLATLHDAPVGCVALRLHPDGTAHVKRLWLSAELRGLGLGRRILAELETHAAAHGTHTLQLETNRALTEAIALYRSAGYREVPPFNDEIYGHHWFEKTLRT